MKHRIIVMITAMAILMSVISINVLAAGTGDGSSLENALEVSTFPELSAALGNPAVNFIETTAAMDSWNTITVPTGKTLIVQPVPDMEYALTMNSRTCNIQSGGTLINNGGIRDVENNFITVDGILQNNAKMDGLKISINGSGSLVNAPGALVADSSTVLLYSGNLSNSGTIACVIHKIGTDAECTVSGVDSAMIRQTNAPVSYANITYNPIALSASDTATVGLVGDNSQLAYAPDTWLMFAKGYSVALTEGQTLVIQTSTDFRSYLYLTKALTAGIDESVSTAGAGGIRYKAEKTQTYYIFVGGYDTFDNGTLSLAVYDPSEHYDGQLDFTNPSTPSSGNGWSWDTASQTLTLSGIMLSSASNNSLILPDGSSLVLAAGTENYIQSDNGNPIVCYGDLNISGSGNLTINTRRVGVTCQGKLNIDVTGKFSVSGMTGIFCGDDLSIKNCSNMIVYGDSIGINSGSAITIENSNLYAYGYSFGIYTGATYQFEVSSIGGDITISNSHVDANCYSTASAAIFAGDNVTEMNPGVHSRIILNSCGILSPAEGYVIDTDFPKGGEALNCQSITSIAELTVLTAWDQAAKNVIIEPACNVTYDANSGTGTLIDSNNSYLRTEKVTVLSNTFSRTGYTFTEWNTTANGSGTNYAPNDTFAVSKDTTLYAQWELDSFAVTFVDWTGTVLSSQNVSYGGDALAPATPTRSGYLFSGWNKTFTNITSNLTVTAQYMIAPTAAPTATPTAAPTATPTAAPTAAPTAVPTAVPSTGVAGVSKSVVAAAAKTGEQSSVETLAFILTISAAALAAAVIVLRKRTQR